MGAAGCTSGGWGSRTGRGSRERRGGGGEAGTGVTGPASRRPEPAGPLGPGVTVAEMLSDAHGCRGLHQRRLGFADGARLAGTAGGRGEAWYVITGTGSLATERAGSLALAPGTAVWLEPGTGYDCQADRELAVLADSLRPGSARAGPPRPRGPDEEHRPRNPPRPGHRGPPRRRRPPTALAGVR